MKTSSDILLEAASILEEKGRWSKGQYFNFNDKGCAMCAHGAIAYCGNPKVKEKVDRGELASSAVSVPAVEAAAGETAQYISIHYGEVGLAHYRATKVGLTIGYNDNPNTTQQDVINKLREAAQLNL